MSVGTCKPSKCYDFLISSLALVESEICPKIIIISNLSNLDWIDYLKSLARESKVELEILDMIDDAELVKLYNEAALVIYALYLEPFGLVPLESMACGTPVIGVKEGGVRESVIHGKAGLLTERDEILFAAAVSELLKRKLKREKFARNGVKLIQNFWTLEAAGKRL